MTLREDWSSRLGSGIFSRVILGLEWMQIPQTCCHNWLSRCLSNRVCLWQLLPKLLCSCFNVIYLQGNFPPLVYFSSPPFLILTSLLTDFLSGGNHVRCIICKCVNSSCSVEKRWQQPTFTECFCTARLCFKEFSCLKVQRITLCIYLVKDLMCNLNKNASAC